MMRPTTEPATPIASPSVIPEAAAAGSNSPVPNERDSTTTASAGRLESLRRLLAVAGLFYLFLLGVNGFGAGFTLIGKGALDAFLSRR